MRIWNGASGAALRSLPVGSVVYAVALSPDNKLVASGSFDGLVRLWDAASGRRLVTLLSLSPSAKEPEWLALAPEGYAASSPALASQAEWRMGGHPVGGAPVWSALQRPELIAGAIRGAKLKAPSFGKPR